MTPTDLKSAREKFDQTQEQFAARLGIGRPLLSRYETGKLEIPKVVELAVQGLLEKYKLII